MATFPQYILGLGYYKDTPSSYFGTLFKLSLMYYIVSAIQHGGKTGIIGVISTSGVITGGLDEFIKKTAKYLNWIAIITIILICFAIPNTEYGLDLPSSSLISNVNGIGIDIDGTNKAFEEEYYNNKEKNDEDSFEGILYRIGKKKFQKFYEKLLLSDEISKFNGKFDENPDILEILKQFKEETDPDNRLQSLKKLYEACKKLVDDKKEWSEITKDSNTEKRDIIVNFLNSFTSLKINTECDLSSNNKFDILTEFIYYGPNTKDKAKELFKPIFEDEKTAATKLYKLDQNIDKIIRMNILSFVNKAVKNESNNKQIKLLQEYCSEIKDALDLTYENAVPPFDFIYKIAVIGNCEGLACIENVVRQMNISKPINNSNTVRNISTELIKTSLSNIINNLENLKKGLDNVVKMVRIQNQTGGEYINNNKINKLMEKEMEKHQKNSDTSKPKPTVGTVFVDADCDDPETGCCIENATIFGKVINDEAKRYNEDGSVNKYRTNIFKSHICSREDIKKNMDEGELYCHEGAYFYRTEKKTEPIKKTGESKQEENESGDSEQVENESGESEQIEYNYLIKFKNNNTDTESKTAESKTDESKTSDSTTDESTTDAIKKAANNKAAKSETSKIDYRPTIEDLKPTRYTTEEELSQTKPPESNQVAPALQPALTSPPALQPALTSPPALQPALTSPRNLKQAPNPSKDPRFSGQQQLGGDKTENTPPELSNSLFWNLPSSDTVFNRKYIPASVCSNLLLSNILISLDATLHGDNSKLTSFEQEIEIPGKTSSENTNTSANSNANANANSTENQNATKNTKKNTVDYAIDNLLEYPQRKYYPLPELNQFDVSVQLIGQKFSDWTQFFIGSSKNEDKSIFITSASEGGLITLKDTYLYTLLSDKDNDASIETCLKMYCNKPRCYQITKKCSDNPSEYPDKVFIDHKYMRSTCKCSEIDGLMPVQYNDKSEESPKYWLVQLFESPDKDASISNSSNRRTNSEIVKETGIIYENSILEDAMSNIEKLMGPSNMSLKKLKEISKTIDKLIDGKNGIMTDLKREINLLSNKNNIKPNEEQLLENTKARLSAIKKIYRNNYGLKQTLEELRENITLRKDKGTIKNSYDHIKELVKEIKKSLNNQRKYRNVPIASPVDSAQLNNVPMASEVGGGHPQTLSDMFGKLNNIIKSKKTTGHTYFAPIEFMDTVKGEKYEIEEIMIDPVHSKIKVKGIDQTIEFSKEKLREIVDVYIRNRRKKEEEAKRMDAEESLKHNLSYNDYIKYQNNKSLPLNEKLFTNNSEQIGTYTDEHDGRRKMMEYQDRNNSQTGGGNKKRSRYDSFVKVNGKPIKVKVGNQEQYITEDGRMISVKKYKDKDNYVDLLMVDNKPMKILVKGLYYYITKDQKMIKCNN